MLCCSFSLAWSEWFFSFLLFLFFVCGFTSHCIAACNWVGLVVVVVSWRQKHGHTLECPGDVLHPLCKWYKWMAKTMSNGKWPGPVVIWRKFKGNYQQFIDVFKWKQVNFTCKIFTEFDVRLLLIWLAPCFHISSVRTELVTGPCRVESFCSSRAVEWMAQRQGAHTIY